ncbi:hypothetical protein RCL1_000875 [Eukaryota sp. TZLM3-RCL]
MSVTFNHNSLQALKDCLDNLLHPDFSLSYNDCSLQCHSALVSPPSQLLASLVAERTYDHTMETDIDASDNVLNSIVSTFYGQPLILSKDNILDVLYLSWNLKALDLYKFAKESVQNNLFVASNQKHTTFQFPISQIISNLANDCFKDQKVVYKDKCIQFHKFLLASVSGWFKKKWSHNWQGYDFIENTSEFTDKLHVNQDCFETFFKSIYTGQLVLSTENVFDYSHLACYFEFDDLTKFINEFINTTPSNVEWIFPAIEKANASLDLRFVALMSDKLAGLDALDSKDGISVEPEVLKTFNFNSVDNQWILKSIVKSFLDCNDKLWNSQEVATCLELIDVSRIAVVEIYNIFLPLLNVTELYDVCVAFSLRILQQYTSTVPIEWIKWFIEQTNQHESSNVLEEFAVIIESILIESILPLLSLTPIKSLCLQLFASNCHSSNLILWVLQLVVKSHQSGLVSLKELKTVLNSFSLDDTDSTDVYEVLDPLINDESTSVVVNDFIVRKLFPKIASERRALQEQRVLSCSQFVHQTFAPILVDTLPLKQMIHADPIPANSTQQSVTVIHRSSSQRVQQHQPSHVVYHKTEVVVPLAQESCPDPLVSSSNRPDSVPIPEDIAFFLVSKQGASISYVIPQGFYGAIELQQFGKTLFFTVFQSLLPFNYGLSRMSKPTTSYPNNCESSFHVHFSNTATSSHVIKALIDLLTHFSSIPMDQLTIVVDQFIKRVDNSEPFSLAKETAVIALLRPFPLALSTLKTRRPKLFPQVKAGGDRPHLINIVSLKQNLYQAFQANT